MAADLIFRNCTVLTMNSHMPKAEACAVKDGHILAVGTDTDVSAWLGPETHEIDLGGACLMPGFIEPHGHPISEAGLWGTGVIDIRPAKVESGPEVIGVIKENVAAANSDGAFFEGWDPLLQEGLPTPNIQLLDQLAPDKPLGILHNSGHSAYFNSKLMEAIGINHDTPDPYGARYQRDDKGNLTGVAYESAAVLSVMAPALRHKGDLRSVLKKEFASLAKSGITTVADMTFDPQLRPLLDEMASNYEIDTRLRLYEPSNQSHHSSTPLANGNNFIKQIGVKLWADGSPWVGNIATSFPYLNSQATQSLGLDENHRGTPIYTSKELLELSESYFVDGWQLACHAYGDIAIDVILDAWEQLLERHPRNNHRLRLEHCGAMQLAQYKRAHQLGVTCSLFIDQIYYWGDVLVDDLFGKDHTDWMAAKSALDSGMRISFHNDSPVTPTEPIRNIATAVSRRTHNGQILAPEQCIDVGQALRAQTIDAAWQIFADDIIGSIEAGKIADLVVLSNNPRTIEAEAINEIEVMATFVDGRQTFGDPLF